jgi:hypothetical protein
MCNPVGILLGALQIAGSISQANAQNKAADAEIEAAKDAKLNDLINLQNQETQFAQQTAVESNQQRLEALKQRSRMMVGIGEVGLGGNTPARSMYSNMLQEAYNAGIMKANKENMAGKFASDKTGIDAVAASRINQAKSKKVDPWTSVFLGLGSGLSGYQQGSELGTTLFGPPQQK